MRLKAPEGRGNPVVRGMMIEPKKGVYEVDAVDGKHLVEAFGYIDVDAPAKATPIGASSSAPVLRRAALEALKQLGVVMSGEPSDQAVADALLAAVSGVNEQMLDAVKRAEHDTEERVLTQLGDKASDKASDKKPAA